MLYYPIYHLASSSSLSPTRASSLSTLTCSRISLSSSALVSLQASFQHSRDKLLVINMYKLTQLPTALLRKVAAPAFLGRPVVVSDSFVSSIHTCHS